MNGEDKCSPKKNQHVYLQSLFGDKKIHVKNRFNALEKLAAI